MAAGVINGLLGTGGGMAAAPLFMRWVGIEEKTALATTVMTILPLSMLSAGFYIARGGVELNTAWPFLAGGLIGGLIAGKLYGRVGAVWLRRGFGALLILGGARMLLS